MSGYQAAHYTEITDVNDGRVPMRAVRHHFGITTFGVNTFTGPEAGDRLINEHDEADLNKEELYLVLEGRARFELDGEELDAPAGTFVYVEPEVKRTAFAEEAGTTLVAVGGGAPGQPYEVEGWEIWSPMMNLFRAGRYAEAADWVLEHLGREDMPSSAVVYYNLACAESLAGRKADALAHLRLAFEADPRSRTYVEGDSDLDPLRDEPEFKELMEAS